ncbi:reverse transcriptase domain-containing protein [Tanacetum coccineum]
MDAAPRVNILDFCEEHYKDILPIIMDKIRHDKYRNPSQRPKVRDHLKDNDGNVFGRLGHRRQSAFDRLSDTYSPSTTKSRPDMTSSRDHSHSRGRPHRRDSSLSRGRPRSRDRSHGIEESYDNTYSSYRTSARHGHHSRDSDPSRIMERGRASESPLSRVSDSEVDPFTPRIRNFKSLRKTRMPNNVKTYDGIGDPEDHVVTIDGYKDLKAAFLAYFMQQKKYVKDPVEIHNIKQRDGETIEDFMERFKVETGRLKGAPECMKISGFMHGVNNPELTKRLNKHVPKTMEEMMTFTTAFIQGETAAASKKKGHAPWKPQDQPKQHVSERKSNFRGKFKPQPPMVTPVEKRSSNKFCDFQNEKGHSTDECMQLKKQIEELNEKAKSDSKLFLCQRNYVSTTDYQQGDRRSTCHRNGNWRTHDPSHVCRQGFLNGSALRALLQPEIKSQMVPTTTSLTGFSGETIWRLGKLRLLVTIGNADHSTKAWMNFMIMRSLSLYNGIIGRPGIIEIQAVPSTAHKMLKFPVDGGIVTIRSTILRPAECAMVTKSSKEILKEAEVCHKNFKVALHPNFPDQEVVVEGTLSEKGRTKLCSLLKENMDIFAWQPSNMTGVPRSVAEHCSISGKDIHLFDRRKEVKPQNAPKPSKRRYKN